MPPLNIDDLFVATLAGEYDGDEPWQAVSELRRNGSREIFERAADWCRSEDALKRARGADILAQLRVPQSTEQKQSLVIPEPLYIQESTAIILDMLNTETDELALRAEIHALGHLGLPMVINAVLRYGGHPNEDIRYAVTHALGHFPNDARVMQALVTLGDDADQDVRNWALFALGTQRDQDSPEMRDLFARHLDDSFPDARQEAIAGLAKRGDERAVLPLFEVMQSGSYFAHLEDDFAKLTGLDRVEGGIGTDDFVDALYARFPHLLPPRSDA